MINMDNVTLEIIHENEDGTAYVKEISAEPRPYWMKSKSGKYYWRYAVRTAEELQGVNDEQ